MNLSLDWFRSHLKKVKQNGNQITALCPSHDDHNPSLSVTEKNGRILVNCFAGCTEEEICNSLGITAAQLFTDSLTNQNCSNEIERIYEYEDENSKLLFQVVRKKGKKFFNRKPLANGEWENNLKDVRRVLYKLPKLKAAQNNPKDNKNIIYICEGEKDVEILEENGFLATCNPHGAGKWRDEYSESLQDLDCVILPDNDDAGRKHAEMVAKSIHGKAASVRVLDLPNLPEKGDISDWFNFGNTAEELQVLTNDKVLWIPNSKIQNERKPTVFSFTKLDDLLSEPDEQISFVLENTLPVGGFSIVSAKPKVGKSTMARNLAVCVSQGKPFLGRETQKGKVLYLCLEEKRAEVKRHFAAMNANGEDILIYTGSTPEDALSKLASAIAEHSPVLVIIDPLSRILRVRDFNDYGSMARGLEPFIDLSREFNTHIQALHHENKGDRNGGDAVLGSTALFGAVDTLIQMKKRDAIRTISSINRYGENLPEIVIELDKDTGIISAQGDLQTIIQGEKQSKILNSIEPGEELAEAVIKDRVGGSNGLISKAIRVLINEGKLIRSGKGGKGSPYIYRKPQADINSQNLLYPENPTDLENVELNRNENDGYSGLHNIEIPRNPESQIIEDDFSDEFLNYDENENTERAFDNLLHQLNPEDSEQMLFEYNERFALMVEDHQISEEDARLCAKQECLSKWQLP